MRVARKFVTPPPTLPHPARSPPYIPSSGDSLPDYVLSDAERRGTFSKLCLCCQNIDVVARVSRRLMNPWVWVTRERVDETCLGSSRVHQDPGDEREARGITRKGVNGFGRAYLLMFHLSCNEDEFTTHTNTLSPSIFLTALSYNPNFNERQRSYV